MGKGLGKSRTIARSKAVAEKLRRKRSDAAKRGWNARRAKAAARSRAAKRGWKARREKAKAPPKAKKPEPRPTAPSKRKRAPRPDRTERERLLDFVDDLGLKLVARTPRDFTESELLFSNRALEGAFGYPENVRGFRVFSTKTGEEFWLKFRRPLESWSDLYRSMRRFYEVGRADWSATLWGVPE